MKIVWAVTESDYDFHSVNSVHMDAEDAFRAAGYFNDEGQPLYGNRMSPLSVEAYALYEKGEAPNDSSILLWAEQERAYTGIYYIPALVRKYEEGKRLDRYEQVILGLIEPTRRDLTGEV